MPTQGEIPIACVLLAAGSAKRMGRDKLRLPFGTGKSVLAQTAAAIAAAPFAERILVTRDPLDFALDGFTVVEIGSEANLGMHRSLKRGIGTLSSLPEAAMICLADQPFLRPEDYTLVMQTYVRGLREELDLFYPTRRGHRGNPAVVHRQYFAEISAEPDADRGCRYLFERYPARVRAWEAPSDAFVRDLDTPEDYRACLN